MSENGLVTSRFCSSHLEIKIDQEATMVLSVGISADYRNSSTEQLNIAVDGVPVAAREIQDSAGSRLHRIDRAPVGKMVVDYTAEIHGETAVADALPIDEIIYTRPSRYCDNDRLRNIGRAHFGTLNGRDLMDAVVAWVRGHIAYVPGSSRVVDGALETYLSRQGVCRDFAHLVIAILRSYNMPARMTSVYAPGLTPMDFHAVVEACWEGQWYLLDATGLAPRESMVRIATGRDASDTAFMTTLAGATQLEEMQVTATVDGVLPQEDLFKAVTLK